jgi:hypothetical protein
VPWVKFRYLDGPCLNVNQPAVSLQAPPKKLVCKRRNYVLFAETPAPKGSSYQLTASYALADGQWIHTPEKLSGERDVFNAWRQLNHAWTHTTSRELKRIKHAGHRLRRAVR